MKNLSQSDSPGAFGLLYLLAGFAAVFGSDFAFIQGIGVFCLMCGAADVWESRHER